MVSADRLHCRPPRSAAMESKLEVEAVLSAGGQNRSYLPLNYSPDSGHSLLSVSSPQEHPTGFGYFKTLVYAAIENSRRRNLLRDPWRNVPWHCGRAHQFDLGRVVP